MNTQKLNVITILTDQQRFDSLSCMGNKVVYTPNLDKLAEEGALFTNASCAYPLCGPSRASLLTGMYSHGHQYKGNAELDQVGLREDVKTIDEILSQNGYHVSYFGKWHTGKHHRECYLNQIMFGHHAIDYTKYIEEKYTKQEISSNQKIDRYTGLAYDYLPLDDMLVQGNKNGFHTPHHNEAGRMNIDSNDTLTAWTVNGFIDFLNNKPKEPFAATCSILHPHAPLIAAEPYFSMFEPREMKMPFNVEDDCQVNRPKCVPDAIPLTSEGLGQYMALYYGLVKEIDDWVGKIMDALEESGLRENTLLIFTSDHGELMGSHGTLSKMELFEEAIRVPFIVNLQGTVKGNQRLDIPTSGVDILPTILDFCGVEIPENIHGKSVKKYVLDDVAVEQEYAYIDFQDQRAIRSKDWKLILNPLQQSNLSERCLLFDLRNDKGEQQNLLSPSNRNHERLEIANSLKHRLVEMMESLNVHENQIRLYRQFEF